MSSFLDLPDELILKVLSYTEIAEVLKWGQVSKRIRTISDDDSLFQTVDLSDKYVKTDLLAAVLNKGCKSLNLSGSSLWGDLTAIPKSQLGILDLSNCRSMCKCETCIIPMLKSAKKLPTPAHHQAIFLKRICDSRK